MITPYIFSETSPSAPGTSVSSQQVQNVTSPYPSGVATPIDDSDALDVFAELVGATGGTLDVYLQVSPDGGQSWTEIVHFPQLAAGAAVVKYQAPVSLFTNATVPVVVGKNLVPALAVNTIVNGSYSDRCRLLFVAGTGTTSGAAVKVTVTPQRSFPRNVG
jgi:hypothetical protein